MKARVIAEEGRMRKALGVAVAAWLALAAAGCGSRGREAVQQDVNDALAELAQTLDSPQMTTEEKLAKARVISTRLQELAEEAKQLGAPSSKTGRQVVNRSQDKEVETARKLDQAARKLAGATNAKP